MFAEDLYEIAATTMEELCFLFSLPEPVDDGNERKEFVVAQVDFVGPVNGYLKVQAQKQLLPILTSNMLGQTDFTEQQQFDALGEVTNVICGNILPRISDSRSVFNIHAPVVAAGEKSCIDVHDTEKAVPIYFDEGEICVRLFYQ